MIFSYVYYTKIYPKKHHHKKKRHSSGHHHHHHHEEEGEERPLLHRRRSSTLTDIAMEPEYHSVFVKYVLPILFVVACGILGFFISGSAENDDRVDIPENGGDEKIKLGPQVMGYLSALLYLGARIPQIIQNHQRKSVHGLSLLFFLFSTLGNLTYAAQILFYRSDWKYVLLNMSWLLGSLGTIFEDSIIFLQFYIYRESNESSIEDDFP
ncbi:YPQ1 Probable vacuolar amino acid transporter YPQ1 [Candida maltosa Xu316]